MRIYQNSAALCRYYDSYWTDYTHPCEQEQSSSARLGQQQRPQVHLLFPNPTHNELNVKTVEEIDHIRLLNVLGQEVMRSPIYLYKKLSLQHLKPGMYSMQFYNGLELMDTQTFQKAR